MKNRALKRWKRENRKDKGVSTAAKIQAHNERVRSARQTVGGWGTLDEHAILLAVSLMGRK